MSSARKPKSFLWKKAPLKTALTVDDLIYLANTRLSLRHLTTKKQLQDNLLADSFLGDAIPLYAAFSHLKTPSMDEQSLLKLFEQHLKTFIEDSITLQDSHLGFYSAESKDPQEQKYGEGMEDLAKKIQERLKMNSYETTYFLLLEMPLGIKIKDQSASYPLGKHGSQRISKNELSACFTLSPKERELLTSCQGSKALIHAMTDIYYAKLCHFIKNERKNFVKEGNPLTLPRPTASSFMINPFLS